jgi:hydroxymethylbilane synthase
VTKTLKVGTRASVLAVAQTETVAAALRAAGHAVELVRITTPGDQSTKPIAEIGVGVFTSALREALRAGAIDLAVHSYKDLPTTPEPDLVVAAVPRRADPRDALVARDGLTLGELPPGSVIGTGSPRRAAQLRALGLGLEVRGIRGNIDTRMGKVDSGEVDAVVLARAGLERAGRTDRITETLDPLQMLPAPAQGALAVECRSADVELEQLLHEVLDDSHTRAAVTAERSMLAALEAGCSAPVGALADVVEDLTDDGSVVTRLSLRGVAAVDADAAAPALLRASITGELAEAESMGKALAAELLERGAAPRA